MHNYSINSDKREKVTIAIFVLAICVNVFIEKNIVVSNIAEYIKNLVLADTTLGNTLSIAVSAVTPISIYWIIRMLYVNIIWKWHFLYRWHKIPDFSGVWIGEVESPLKKEKNPEIKVTVRQNWDKISIITKTKNSQAKSSQAEIEVDDCEEVILHYSYDCNRNGKCYKGFNSLKYDYGHKIEGDYFTNKEIDFVVKGTSCKDSKIVINNEVEINDNDELKDKVKKGMGSKGVIKAERCH